MNKFTLTCLIPFYNEQERCVKVLEILATIPEIDCFICVDDGSTDNTTRLVQTTFPQVKIIVLPENRGKSAAVQAGLEEVTTMHTLLFDADMHDFSAEEVQAGIQAVRNNRSIDLLIFQQKNDPLLSKVLSTDVLFSGERIGKTAALRAACKQKVSGYFLELAINHFFFSQQYVVRCMPLHASNYMKLQKWPIQTALKKSWQLFSLLCSSQFWQQRQQLRRLQSLFLLENEPLLLLRMHHQRHVCQLHK